LVCWFTAQQPPFGEQFMQMFIAVQLFPRPFAT